MAGHNFYRRLGGSTTRQPPIGAKPPAREGGRSIYVGTVTRAGICFTGEAHLYAQQGPSLRRCFIMGAQRLAPSPSLGSEGAQSFHSVSWQGWERERVWLLICLLLRCPLRCPGVPNGRIASFPGGNDEATILVRRRVRERIFVCVKRRV